MRRRHPLVRMLQTLERRMARDGGPGSGPPSPLESPLATDPLLRGHVDDPRPGSRVAPSHFTVRGWSTWGGKPALAVAVQLDGVTVATAAVGSEQRGDVAEALDDPKLVESGWRVDVASADIADGSYDLSVIVWGEPSGIGVLLDRFTMTLERTGADGDVVAGGFDGTLDLPRPGERVGPVFLVSGWALHEAAPVTRLDVLVDGLLVGHARMGLARPDVAGLYRSPEATISGFEHWVDLSASAVRSGARKVQIVAWPRNGPATAILERVVHLVPIEDAPAREPGPTRGAASARARKSSTQLGLVVFTHQLDYGGGQLWLEEFLLNSGAGSRYGCSVIAYRDGPLRRLMEQRGISVHVTQAPPVDDIEQYEGRITELCTLVGLGDHNAALVNTGPIFSGADVATRLGIPTVWAIHESLTPDALLTVAFGGQVDSGVREAARRAMGHSAALVFEAEATRLMYAPWEPRDRSVVVPYGVNTRLIEEYCGRVSKAKARADIGYDEDARILLVMGTVEHRKAQTRIAEAFAELAAGYPDWSLVFVGGSESPYSDALRSYIRSVGLRERAAVMPVDKDTYRWYRSADLLLSASDMESLPRSMLEAMCFGATIVSTSVYGTPELIDDGVTGFLFEPNDLDATVRVLRRVLDLDHQERTRVGEAGRRHVIENYDSSGYAEDLMALFHGFREDAASLPSTILAGGGRNRSRAASPTELT